MEITLEKVIKNELSSREDFSANAIEATLNSKINLREAKLVDNYRQWKKF